MSTPTSSGDRVMDNPPPERTAASLAVERRACAATAAQRHHVIRDPMFIAREGILGRTITAMSEFKARRHESGLASLMTVIDATAKKRYPKLGNADRFKKFLGEEIGKQLGGIFISL